LAFGISFDFWHQFWLLALGFGFWYQFQLLAIVSGLEFWQIKDNSKTRF